MRWAGHVACMGEEYKTFISSLCNLLQSPLTSSFLGPNILLNTLFSNTKLYIKSKSAPEDGRVCRPKHVKQIQIDQ